MGVFYILFMDKIENEENIKNLINYKMNNDENNETTVIKHNEIQKHHQFVDYVKLYNLPIASTILGIYSHNFLKNYMKVGIDGVNYYGEAHLTKWNSWMHTIGMPFTIFGMIVWIPALLRLKPSIGEQVAKMLFYTYGGHYLRINIIMTLFYYLIYIVPVNLGNKYYRNYYIKNTKKTEIIENEKKQESTTTLSLSKKINNDVYNKLLMQGLGISTTALVFQEIVGHWVGGDIPSRFEAIPNAILYAKLFSIHHLFY